ncbi:hypothetical protein HN873_038620 [Arachis hypogaea]
MAFRYLFAFLLALCLSHPPHSVLVAQNLPYKAVNLGNWLLAEGWMKPSLFDGNANKGWNSSAANATKFQKYLAAENGGGADLVANCTSASASGWETFKLWWVSDTSFNFRVFNKQFLRMEKQFQDIDGLEDIKLIFSSFEILLKMKLSSADFCPSPPEGLMKEKGEARKEKLRSEGKEKNFEWAWQHPVESLAVRKAAANFKSLSGVANKIKLAYTMLTLPSWQRNIYLGKANHNLKSVLAITNMKPYRPMDFGQERKKEYE